MGENNSWCFYRLISDSVWLPWIFVANCWHKALIVFSLILASLLSTRQFCSTTTRTRSIIWLLDCLLTLVLHETLIFSFIFFSFSSLDKVHGNTFNLTLKLSDRILFSFGIDQKTKLKFNLYCSPPHIFFFFFIFIYSYIFCHF